MKSDIINVFQSRLTKKDKDKIALIYETKKPTEFTESVSGPLQIHLKNEEANEIRNAMLDANFDENEVSKRLNISLSDLRAKVSEYGFSSLVYAFNYFESENPAGVDLDSYIEKIESRIILSALKAAGSNKINTAKLLGITFRSLRHRLENKIEFDSPTSEFDYFKNLETRSIDEFLDNIEMEIIRMALKRSENNKTQASDLLKISFRSFRYKLDKHYLADKDI